MKLNPDIFREYDVRGVVGRDLTDEGVEWLGRAFGTCLRRHGHAKATVGRDCRLSSPGFGAAIIRGLRACGVDVVDVGVVPTPILYFSMFHLGIPSGVMVTGSHNPKDFNGFKLCMNSTAIHGDAIRAVRDLADSGDFEKGNGTLETADVVPAYHDRLASDARLGPRRPRIVVDAGNGTGDVAVPLFERLGLSVIPLFCERDGNFPHHHPDPTVPANLATLIDTVRSQGADLGVAFDGDADRLGIVTEDGGVVFGDMILLVLGRALLREVPGAEVVSEVKCSQVLFDEIARAGGKALMWRVGHSLIKAKMAEDAALLGGEMSGHIFFRHRWFGFDDAIYSALRFLEVLTAHEGTASSLLADVPRTVSTPEIRIDCGDDVKFEVVRRVTASIQARGLDVVTVDGARVRTARGWGLVRASNTQPILVSRYEADSAEGLDEVRALVTGEIAAAEAAILWERAGKREELP
jgi:phosphomannomutase/phosphoglucomutase